MNLVVCDDHRLLAQCLTGLLGARGHPVVATVDHPDDALVITGAGDAAVHVCVMDLSFPGVTAFDAIRAIATARPDTKVVVLSACAPAFSEPRAIEAGAAAFVMKDDDVGRVIAVVEAVHCHDGTLERVAPSRNVAAPGVDRSGATG